VGTGIAADCHDGKTKKLTQEQIQSIKDQISKLEELKQKCQNLHAQGTDLLQSVLQKLLLPPSSKL
jgi:formate-dependent nitrite reductase cytochrome c552 subunit